MSLPGWMGRLAQPWLPRGGTRRPVRPCLEVLEDRLTPSGDGLALATSNLSPSSDSQYNAFINSQGNPLASFLSNLPSTSSASLGGQSALTGNGNSAIQQQIAVQLVDDLGHLVTTLSNVLAQGISPSGTGPAGFTIPSNGGGTPTLTATQQEILQGLNSLVFTTSPLTPTAGQNSQPTTLQFNANNSNTAAAPGDGPIIYLASNPSSPLGSSMEFVDANSDHNPTA